MFWSLLCAGVDPSLQIDHRIHASSQVAPPGSKQNKPRVANSRDERFRSGRNISLLNSLIMRDEHNRYALVKKKYTLSYFIKKSTQQDPQS